MNRTLKDGEKPPAVAGKKPFLRRGRIAWTLSAVLLLIGLAPLALMAWKQTQFNRVALATAQQEYQLLVAETIAREVDIHVDGLRVELLRVSQTLGGAIRRTGGPDAELRRDLAGVVDERMPYLRYDYFLKNTVRSIDAGELSNDLKPIFNEGLKDAAAVLTEAAQTRPSWIRLGHSSVSTSTSKRGSSRRTNRAGKPRKSNGRMNRAPTSGSCPSPLDVIAETACGWPGKRSCRSAERDETTRASPTDAPCSQIDPASGSGSSRAIRCAHSRARSGSRPRQAAQPRAKGLAASASVL